MKPIMRMGSDNAHDSNCGVATAGQLGSLERRDVLWVGDLLLELCERGELAAPAVAPPRATNWMASMPSPATIAVMPGSACSISWVVRSPNAIEHGPS